MNKYRNIFLSLILYFPLTSLAAKNFKIILVKDLKNDYSPIESEPLIENIRELFSNSSDVKLDVGEIRYCSHNAMDCRKVLAEIYSENIDLVITLGYTASDEAIKLSSYKKPTIVGSLIDYSLQNAPYKKGRSGVRNLTYIRGPNTTRFDVKMIELFPAITNVLMYENEFIVNNPSVDLYRKKVTKLFQKKGYILSYKSFPEDIQSLEKDISNNEFDAVFIGVKPNISSNFKTQLAQTLLKQRTIGLARNGRSWVEGGIIASRPLKSLMTRKYRRIAIASKEISRGERAENMSVDFNEEPKIILNSNLYSLYPFDTNLLFEWDVSWIGSFTSGGPSLSISQALSQLAKKNYQIKISKQSVYQSKQAKYQALSNLLPSLEFNYMATKFEAENKTFELGETSQNVDLQLKQMIYNNQAVGGYLAANAAYKSQIDSYKYVNQNEIQDVLISFLKALKAKTLYSVERENLAMTQANIRRAKSRINSGISNKSELYRWQNQLAIVQKASISALSDSQAATLDLTQKIGDKVSLRYDLIDITDDDPFYKRAKAVTNKYLLAGLFKKYRSKFINYILRISPEIKSLNNAKKSQDYMARAYLQDHFIPSFSFVGTYGKNLSQEFKNDFSAQFTRNPKNDWSVSVVASLPLVAGGGTEAKRKEYRSAATSYALQRDDTARQLVQGLLTSSINLHTDYATISIDARAAVAAENNLRLLTAQYTRGTISIIDLLDAQTQFIRTQESSQSSKLQFLASYTQWIRYLNLIESINSDNIFKKIDKIIGE